MSRTTGMLRKLQIKFVVMVMVVVAVILAAVFACALILTNQDVEGRLHEAMEGAIDRTAEAAVPPSGERGGQPRSGSEGKAADGEGWFAPPELGRHPSEPSGKPVAVYRLKDGVLDIAPRSSALLDEAGLTVAASVCADAPLGTGSIPSLGLVFLKRSVADEVYVAFAADEVAANQQNLIMVFAGVGIGAFVLFLVASVLFSRWALRPVQMAWDQQRVFVANASHELKTPLSIIKANTEILLEEPDATEADRVRWLRSTKNAADGMTDLVGDLLTLAGLDEREETKNVANAVWGGSQLVDVARVVEGCALSFESRALEEGFTLKTDVQEPMEARLDADALKRIVDILLDNACKYVKPNGLVTVQLVACANHEAALRVTNTGPALDPETMTHLFDRFYRSPEARGSSDGHGLGLAIAQELAQQMKAELTASSEEGQTVFSLRFSWTPKE